MAGVPATSSDPSVYEKDPLVPQTRVRRWPALAGGAASTLPRRGRVASERFYNLSYERGLKLARCTFEQFRDSEIVEHVQQRRTSTVKMEPRHQDLSARYRDT